VNKRSSKSYTVAVCLSGIFGLLGIHHFYLGRWIHGLFDVSLTFLALYFIYLTENILLGFLILALDIIHTFIVTVMLLVGSYKDSNGQVVTYPNQKI
jgi:TM2 domain-containing membrane protein YozV